jgi:DNA-binding beta-propeller fold protein YncE
VNDTEGATVATIPGVGGYAITDLAVDPNGTRAYAGLSGYSSYYQHCTGFVSMIDTARYAVIDDIDIAVSPDTITAEVVSVFVEFEVAVPHLRPAWW